MDASIRRVRHRGPNGCGIIPLPRGTALPTTRTPFPRGRVPPCGTLAAALQNAAREAKCGALRSGLGPRSQPATGLRRPHAWLWLATQIVVSSALRPISGGSPIRTAARVRDSAAAAAALARQMLFQMTTGNSGPRQTLGPSIKAGVSDFSGRAVALPLTRTPMAGRSCRVGGPSRMAFRAGAAGPTASQGGLFAGRNRAAT